MANILIENGFATVLMEGKEMKNNNKKTIVIITFVAIFVFALSFSIFSSPYKTERIKQFVNSAISKVADNS